MAQKFRIPERLRILYEPTCVSADASDAPRLRNGMVVARAVFQDSHRAHLSDVLDPSKYRQTTVNSQFKFRRKEKDLLLDAAKLPGNTLSPKKAFSPAAFYIVTQNNEKFACPANEVE